jgi:hypothetical protein
MVVSPVVISGCAARVRVYDEEHRDYHSWNHGEVVYYQRWEGETHRDHKDFNRRTAEEKREYWNWRHAHMDNDRH